MVSTSVHRLACIPAALLCAAPSAWADEAVTFPAIASQWPANLDFDLVRDCPKAEIRQSADPINNVSNTPQPATWADEVNGISAKEELGPSWKMESSRGGPVLEIAALGAGKKDRPGLAHLAIDWNF